MIKRITRRITSPRGLQPLHRAAGQAIDAQRALQEAAAQVSADLDEVTLSGVPIAVYDDDEDSMVIAIDNARRAACP